MKNFLIRYDKDGKVVPFDEILELINKKEGKKIVDLTDEEVKDLKKRIHSCDKIFEEKIYYDYKQLFTALRQGQIQSFEGIHRKVVKYLRAVSEQRRLISFSEEEKARLLRVRQIYESMKLRTSETKDLKQWFGNAGVDVESDDLSKIGPQKIVEVLEKFFDEYLSQKPDTYFGGIRTDKDLDYKIIGWTA